MPSILATHDELQRLLHIVETQCPKLKREYRGKFAELNEQEHVAGFAQAFRWLAHIGRSDKLDTSHALSWWVDHAEQCYREIGTTGLSINTVALTAACVAWGDIAYAKMDNFPFDFGLGLVAYGGRQPTQATWRRVLSTEIIREPSNLPARMRTAPDNVRINGVNALQISARE